MLDLHMLRVDLVEARLLQRQCSYYHTGLRDLLQGYIKHEQDLSLPGVSHLRICCHTFGSMTISDRILLDVVEVLGDLKGRVKID